jgi:hypothetical protein
VTCLDAAPGATDNSAMTTHPLRFPFALDPLIAEAKRRARQRRFLVAVAVFVVVAAGSAAALIASSSSDVMPLRAALAPSVLEAPHNNREGDGRRGHFSIVVGLTNGAREPVSLERVRAVVNARSSLKQFASSFRLYRPPVCPRAPKGGTPGLCIPSNGFTLPPNGARPPAPLRVAPGHEALVQLSFRFAGCMKRAMLESVSMQKFTVVYRLPNGARIYQHPGLPLPRPAATAFGRSSISASPALPGQPASPRLHTIAWVTTNRCHR